MSLDGLDIFGDRSVNSLSDLTKATEELRAEAILHPQHILRDEYLAIDTTTCTDPYHWDT